jgi:hypothetical protein
VISKSPHQHKTEFHFAGQLSVAVQGQHAL